MGDRLPSRRIEIAVVAGLVACAALLRWLRWENTAVLFNDGPAFLQISRSMAAGDWSSAFSHPFHPLYSFLTALVQRALGDWEPAAVAVSVTAGGTAVLFLYLFLRDAFGWPACAVGAALLTVHYRAVNYSSDVQSDGLYLALFLAGLWLLWRAFRSASPGRAALAGAAAGLAYLTRPEGLGLAVVGAGLAGICTLRKQWRWGLGAAWVAALLVGTSLFVLPYAAALRAETGAWTLTQKKSVARLVGLYGMAPERNLAPRVGEAGPEGSTTTLPSSSAQPEALPPAAARVPRRVARAVGELSEATRRAARHEVVVLLILGLAVSRGRPGLRGELLLALVLLYGAVLFALTLNHGYVSHRHALPLVVACFGYAAVGIPVLGRWLGAALRRGLAVPVGGGWAALALGLVPVMALALGHQLRPRRADAVAERQAAEWFRSQLASAVESPAPVAARRRRIAYYAAAPYVSLRDVSPADPIGDLRKLGARYVIVDQDQGGLSLAKNPEVRVVHRARAAGREACVLELLSEPSLATQRGEDAP
jgi:4-amino-4-deoxy-L-arabinose transferase-like glycosyltransferase